MNTTIEFCILELMLVPNFNFNWQFWFVGPNLPKRVFPVKNRKSGHRHWILHIRLSPGTKFQLKLTFLMFWTKFAQKGYFRSEREKLLLCLRPWLLLTVWVTYCLKLFRTGANRYNGILMSLLVTETIK